MTDHLSVIIPNYGDGDVLPRALRSIEDAAPGAEVIVVTNDMIDPSNLPQESINLRVMYEPPQPAGHNRNVGLDYATREFVMFCDADDEVVSGGVNPRIQTLQSGFDIAVGDPVYVTGDENRHERLGEPDDAASEYLRETWVPVLGCAIVRRAVFDDWRFWETIDRAQDFHLWARLFAEYDVGYVSQPVYRYHQFDNQRSRRGLPRRYACQALGAAAVAADCPRYARPAGRRSVRAAWIALKQAAGNTLP